MTINLRDIKERCEKASKGPWWESESNPELYSSEVAFMPTYEEPWTEHAILFETSNMEGDDVEFIKHARTDVPALVAWIEQITEVVEQLIPHADKAMTHHPFICHCPVCRAQRLLAEVTR